MKRFLNILLTVGLVFAVACSAQERTIVILSTNDMHAKIQRIPALASAVQACRDTAQLVVLVDAGDRWTGNSFVDKIPAPGMPMIRLMNRLGYDAVTLGNHEFDFGQAYLGKVLDSMDFAVVCANVVSDTVTFPQLPPYVILERDGIRIGVVGVVTNYEGNGYPAGNKSSFVGLTFPDPQLMAAKYGEELRKKCDVLILLSHMGDDRDMEFLAGNTSYDELISGHTHVIIDSVVNGTSITQTGKDLWNVGVSVIRMKGKQVERIETRIVPLKNYPESPEYAAMVQETYSNPELCVPMGNLANKAEKIGLAGWMAEAMAEATDAEIGIYHIGGVRIDALPAGEVNAARIYDLEPFGTLVATMTMTPEQMREMILLKYNDAINRKESHRLDLIATTPYTIVTDGKDAIDVQFPKLQDGRAYTIAVSDYVFRNYNDLHYTDGKITDIKVADALIEELKKESPIKIDNKPKQQIK